jgi:flagellar protein FliS
MDPKNSAKAYRAAAIENAPPLKIVRMLYHGCIRFMDQAISAHGEGDLPQFNTYVGKAEAIVSELRSSLDRERAPEMAEQLEGLYLFAFARLIDAIAGSSTEPLEDARAVLEVLLDAWNELELSGEAS